MKLSLASALLIAASACAQAEPMRLCSPADTGPAAGLDVSPVAKPVDYYELALRALPRIAVVGSADQCAQFGAAEPRCRAHWARSDQAAAASTESKRWWREQILASRSSQGELAAPLRSVDGNRAFDFARLAETIDARALAGRIARADRTATDGRPTPQPNPSAASGAGMPAVDDPRVVSGLIDQVLRDARRDDRLRGLMTGAVSVQVIKPGDTLPPGNRLPIPGPLVRDPGGRDCLVKAKPSDFAKESDGHSPVKYDPHGFPEIGLLARDPVASVEYKLCGFVIFHRRWALTALHCVAFRGLDGKSQRHPELHDLNGSKALFLVQRRDRDQTKLAPCFDPADHSDACSYRRIRVVRIIEIDTDWPLESGGEVPSRDLALLELDPDTTRDIRLAVIEFPEQSALSAMVGKPVTVTGYGASLKKDYLTGRGLLVGWQPGRRQRL